MKLNPLPADELVALRKSLGMTQSDFWMRLGVTQSGGSRYESGRDMPKPVRMLIEIAYGKRSDQLVAVLRQL